MLIHRVHSHAPNLNMRMLNQLPFSQWEVFRSYHLPGNLELTASDYLTDLGITVTNNFNFESHINQVSKKANLKCSWILSVFHCREEQPLLNLFKSLVLSMLEYCSPLWCPDRFQDISKLESVQRRFTSKMMSISHLNYWDRLKHLNLMSLQRRRERFQVIYIWKINNKKVPNFCIIVWRDITRRGNTIRIPELPSTVAKINSTFDCSFRVKACKIWNCLPKYVKEPTSMNIFKNKLDSFLLRVPDCPPVSGYSTMNSNSLLDWLTSSNAY